jgi:hypothetical protein
MVVSGRTFGNKSFFGISLATRANRNDSQQALALGRPTRNQDDGAVVFAPL